MTYQNKRTVANLGPEFFLAAPDSLDPDLPRDMAQLLDLVDPGTLAGILDARPDLVRQAGRYTANGVYADYTDGSKIAMPWLPTAPDQERPPIMVEGDLDSIAHRTLRIAYQMKHEAELAAQKDQPHESGEDFARRILGGMKYTPKA